MHCWRLELHGDADAGGEIQGHKAVNCGGGGVFDVNETGVCSDLVVVLRILMHEG